MLQLELHGWAQLLDHEDLALFGQDHESALVQLQYLGRFLAYVDVCILEHRLVA